MNDRLKLKQQQESHESHMQSATELATLTLLTTLGCSGILALNDFSVASQQWLLSLLYLTTLAMIASAVCLMESRLASGEPDHQSNGAATLSDEQADRILQTPTTPLNGPYCHNMQRNRVVRHSADVLAIEPCQQPNYWAFSIACVVALLVALMLLADWLQLNQAGLLSQLKSIPAELQTMLVLGGVAIVAVIIGHLRKPATRVMFDMHAGVFWIEYILLFGFKTKVSAQMPIAHIVALQRLGKTDERDDQLRFSLLPFRTPSDLEINVVFRNSDRVNLFNAHSSCPSLRELQRVSGFLSVPVWQQESS